MNLTEFMSKCRKDFGSHALHRIRCPDKAASLTLLKSLSFVTVSERGLKLPSHIQAQAFIASAGEVEVVIAGKLSVDENMEVLQAARSRSFRIDSVGKGEAESATLQAALERLTDRPGKTDPPSNEPPIEAEAPEAASPTASPSEAASPAASPSEAASPAARRREALPPLDEHGVGPAVALLLLGAAGLAAYWYLHRA